MGLPQDRVLAASDVGEDPLEAFAFGLALLGGAVVDAVEVGGQDLPPVRAEHAVGEEA
ncbi:hypothetical protein [Saccharopolyspora spinosa]|uniref:hypothetical protein n=1 Tax=Saccharopolyspora spinosa TaxID=60894 RepID=UPI00192CBA65|nr:hypothetical protein [Saccharopolyspora spinosa]